VTEHRKCSEPNWTEKGDILASNMCPTTKMQKLTEQFRKP